MAAAPSPVGPESLGHRAALDAGIALLDAGQASAAVPYLRRANEVRPTSIGLVRLGGAYRDLGDPAEAISTYEQALTMEGRGTPDLHARVGLAAVLADEDQLEALTNAAELLVSVIDVEPLNSPALFSLARCYDRVWRLTGSEHFREAAEQARARARAADPRTDEQRRDALRLRAVTAQRTVDVRPLEPVARNEAAPAAGPEPADAATSDRMAADTGPANEGAAIPPAEAGVQSGRCGPLARLVALVRRLRR